MMDKWGDWIDGSMYVFPSNKDAIATQLAIGNTMTLEDNGTCEGAIKTIDDLKFKRRYIENNRSEYIMDNDSRRKCLKALR